MIWFCEKYEILEEVPIAKKKQSTKKEGFKSSKKNKKHKVHFQSSFEESSDDSDTSYKYCEYHGKSNHTTEDYKDIKRLINKDKKRKHKNHYNDKQDHDREYKKSHGYNYVKKSEINAQTISAVNDQFSFNACCTMA